MFQESLVESTAMLRTRSRKPFYTAAAIQATIAAVLITLPMLRPEILPMHAPPMTLTAPPLHKQAPPPEPQRVRVQEAAASSGPVFQQEAPPTIGTSFRPVPGTSIEDLPTLAPISMGTGNGVPVGVGIGTPAGPAVSVRPEPAHKGPMSISTGVMAGMLLEPIRPIYPRIAQATHTEGSVVIEAVIATSGRIESAHVVSGPAMLQSAALDAVRSARYKPYLLNGLPTEVQTTITVNFKMGS